MKTLLFHKTTDSDLSKGLTVAYNDTNGQPTLTGIIEDIEFVLDGTPHYIVNGVAYIASELKLIEKEPCKNWEELKEAVNNSKSFVAVTEELYYEAIEVLPPIWLKNGCFQVDEPFMNDLYHTFGRKGDSYYGCICNKNFALHNF